MRADPQKVVAVFDRPGAEHLYRGPKSDIYLNPDGATVTKVYRDGGNGSARRAARTEFERLRRLHYAFLEVEGVSCPRPIALEKHADRWCLTMELAPGTPLLSFARQPERPSATEVARRLARAMETYERVIARPHYGVKPQDVRVVMGTGELILLDFEPSHAAWHRGLSRGEAAARVSAGIFLGRVLHLTAAPRMLGNRAFAGWLTEVALETVARLGNGGGDRLATVVKTRYRRGFERYACWWRPLWYRVAWLAVGRPAIRRLLTPGG